METTNEECGSCGGSILAGPTPHGPQPFVQTETADEILAAVQRFRQRTSRSAH